MARRLTTWTTWTTIAIILLLLGAAGGREAAAQPPVKEPPRAYQSPMRAQCEAELDKDRGWRAELKDALRPEVHEAEAALIQKNEKHVVMAYAALWVLTVAFLVLLWFRQARLVREIAALEEKVAKAAEQ